MTRGRLVAMVLAVAAGSAIAWVDTRPHWDDTAITAGAVLIASGLGALAISPFWLSALLVAGPMIVVEVPHGLGVLLAAPFALAEAGMGALVRRAMRPRRRSTR